MRDSKIKMRVLSVFILICAACSISDKKTTDLDFNPIQNYKTAQFKNGIQVLMVPDTKLPYLSISAITLNGASSDPDGQSGLTAATMELLTKGTKKQTAEQLSESIEVLGADLDVSVDKDYSSMSLEGLSWHEDTLIDLFSDMLLSPRFQQQELDRYIERTSGLIQQRLDQASTLASEVLEKKIYAGTPYAERDVGTLETVKTLTVKGVFNQYQKLLNPENMWFVVVGKSSPEILEKLEKKFSKLRSRKMKSTFDMNISKIVGRNILVVDKPDSAQAEIRLGHFGIQRDASDYMATSVANSVLGQGFTSRLVDRVRDQLGLTYSISSSFEVRKKIGYFSIRTFTQNERVGQALSETLSIYKNFHESGITSRELKQTQDSMIAKLPMLLETPEKLAYNLMILRLFNVSDDYLKKYSENVRSLDLKIVNSAIQKNFDPENLWVVILGKADVIVPQVRDLGKVEKILYKDVESMKIAR